MPLVLADRVQQTGTANTTVSFTLTGSSTGFQSFAVIGNTNTTYYSAFDQSGNWETGLGTYSTTGPTLTRTTVFASSNSGLAVTFSGTVNVFVTYPSSQGLYITNSGGQISLQAQPTDSTATGGNVRGANAVDWQTTRVAASNVASGAVSVVGGGYANTANNAYGGVFNGFNNTAGYISVVVGGQQNQSTGSSHGAVVGGQANTANGYFNFIGGGFTNSGTSASAVTTQSGTMNGTTAVTLSGSNANIRVGQIIFGTSIAADTYVAAISGTSLTLSKNASGSSTSTLSFFTPHGVVVGGGNNQATGSYSFIGGGGDAGTAANRNTASGDYSVVVGGRNNVASGIGAFVGGGGTVGNNNTFANTASNTVAVVVGGIQNTASGLYSFVGGGYGNQSTSAQCSVAGGVGNIVNGSTSAIMGGAYGTTRGITGYHVFSACVAPLSTTIGQSQAGMLILAKQTTDATATALTSDGSAASGTNQVILPNNSAYYFKGSVIAGVTGGGNSKAWAFEGAIKRGATAASTTIVGTAVLNTIAQDAGASTWTIAITADTTNGGLAVTVTGQASTTIRWVCKVETTEMTY